jgi:hypothetical protein
MLPRAALLFVAAFTVASCARVLSSHDLAPNGLTRAEHAFRLQMETGRADSALFLMASGSEKRSKAYSPGDELLRSLYAGLLAHYAGRWEQSAESLDRAVLLAEDRVTKSISRAALSVVTSDGALEYVPGRTERMLIHYYAALDFARQGSLQAAAVEARRLSGLLERYDDESPGDDTGMRSFLRYFAGTIFEAAGQANDASVAYRNARAALSGLPQPDTSARAGTGEVILLVERGFVAHKVEEALVVALDAREARALSGDNDDDDDDGDYDQSDVVTLVASRVLQHAGDVVTPVRRQRTRFISLPEQAPRRARTETCTVRAAASSSAKSVKNSESVEVTEPVKGTGTVRITESAVVAGTVQVTESVQVTNPVQAAETQPAVPQPEPSAPRPDTAAPAAPKDSASGVTTRRPGRVRYEAVKSGAAKKAAAQQQHGAPSCEHRDGGDGNSYLLRMAWPAFEYERTISGSVTAHLDGNSVSVPPLLHANVSNSVTADFDSQRPAILARTILRAAMKLSLTRAAEKSGGKENEETVGRVLGALTNLGGVLTERADTRSWHLLPGSLSIVRLRVPAGAQRVTIQIDDGWNSIHTVAVPVQVKPGRINFASTRVWR